VSAAALPHRISDAARTSNQHDYWTVSPRPGTTPILGLLTDTVEEMLAIVAPGRCMCITAQSLARA
jgi:hypothetical protein